MSEREALARFHDWRAARHRKAEKRRLWRSRCIRLAVPLSIGLVALAPAAVTSGPHGADVVEISDVGHCLLAGRPLPPFHPYIDIMGAISIGGPRGRSCLMPA